MPLYVYVCQICHKSDEAWRPICDRDVAPQHCNQSMHRILMPTMVQPDISPYRAIAADKETGEQPYIKSRKQHKEFLARNGYEEIGNEVLKKPKPIDEKIMIDLPYNP